MNGVEQATWNCIRELMLAIDPERKGWCIDAGVGDQDYYFEWFHNFGYPTLAIEPFPNDGVRERCNQNNARLFVGALSDKDDFHAATALYTDGDLHALYPDYWVGVRDMQQKSAVCTATLRTLIREHEITRLTALKLDIEGAESAVIHQLPMLRSCPSILSFEFGGIVEKHTQQGAWSSINLWTLKSSLQVLKEVGYSHLLIVAGNTADTHLRAVKNEGVLDGLFEDSDVWGNIIAVRRGKYDLVAMAQTDVRFAP